MVIKSIRLGGSYRDVLWLIFAVFAFQLFPVVAFLSISHDGRIWYW